MQTSTSKVQYFIVIFYNLFYTNQTPFLWEVYKKNCPGRRFGLIAEMNLSQCYTIKGWPRKQVDPLSRKARQLGTTRQLFKRAANLSNGLVCFTITRERPGLFTEATLGCYPASWSFTVLPPLQTKWVFLIAKRLLLCRLQVAALSARISVGIQKIYYWIFCKFPLQN